MTRLFFSGLSRQVFFWFLFVSLIPVCLVSFINYQSARDQLVSNAERGLVSFSTVQINQIRDNFDRIRLDLEVESERSTTGSYLMELIKSFQGSDLSANQFVKSYQWALLEEKHAHDLKNLAVNYGYHDIFLIDKKGNILFSVAKENDLGRNLFEAPLLKSRFSTATRTTLETGKITFSDLESYIISGDLMAGFLVSPVFDENGDEIGAMAVQLSKPQIDEALGHDIPFGKTGKRYLIGSDLALRTPGSLGKDYPVLERPVKTRNTEVWQARSTSKAINQDRGQTLKKKVLIYPGPNGKSVLGIQFNINIAGVNWGYIAEIDEDEVLAQAHELAILAFAMVGITIISVLIIVVPVTQKIVQPISKIAAALGEVGKGDLDQDINITGKNEVGDLGRGFNDMLNRLRISNKMTADNTWLSNGVRELNDEMQGDMMVARLSHNIIGFLCRYFDAKIGTFYVVKGEDIQLMGSYAFRARKGFSNKFRVGEGMVGQAVLEKQTIVWSDIPDDYMAVSSGLGEARPNVIMVIPILWNEEVVAVFEIAAMDAFNNLQEKFLGSITTSIGTSIQTALSRERTKELLDQTQSQAEELSLREKELLNNNELLESQAIHLQDNQSELEEANQQLHTQQEELRVANEELEEKAKDLNYSRRQLENRNQSLEDAKLELERRAEELSVSGEYKTEFLANMSHELRTPLNSLLILSKMLADNQDGNLTEKQVNYSTTIYDSGFDLLTLINDILDLSKIEAGKMNVNIDIIDCDNFVASLQSKFNPIAADKGVKFKVKADEAPDTWSNDVQKLDQIIKNLLSNAFKFTNKGSVTLEIGPVPKYVELTASQLSRQTALSFIVSDTGIGIAEGKQKVIFEAFQQADGTNSREYGGSGLGLSISRELAELLGGEIYVKSEEGKGSCFVLTIPKDVTNLRRAEIKRPAPKLFMSSDQKYNSGSVTETRQAPSASTVPDDRGNLDKDERSILIVEDDVQFSAIVADLARERGFKVLVVGDGRTALDFAETYQPSGIILDIALADLDGYQVMEQLKDSASTRHIPVHIMSAQDATQDAFKKGAIGFLTKPVSKDDMEGAFQNIEKVIDRSVKRLMIVGGEPVEVLSMREMIGNGDVEINAVNSIADALKNLENKEIDCVILNLGLSDKNGLGLLNKMRDNDLFLDIPVVVYLNRELKPEERITLDLYAESIVIKDVRSHERLLDDTALFLHRIESNLPEKQRQIIRMLHDPKTLFANRKVLVVDDDLRNVFSLTSVLEKEKMEVLVANNGIEALEQLEANSDIAIVLMDIMMPLMDGYEACKKIREQKRFIDLPIIALTAKAMKEDRSLCIEAGASDYIAKPVLAGKLLSMMHVWLYR